MLLTISIWSVLFPVVIGFSFFNNLNTNSRIIWATSALAAVPQLIRYASFMDGRRMLFYNLYTVAEFILYVIFFLVFINNEKLVKRISLIFSILFTATFLLLLCKRNITTAFYHEGVVISNLFVVNMVLLALYAGVAKNNFQSLLSRPTTFYIVGLFFYAPVTVLIYSLWDFLKQHEHSPLQQLWMIHHISNTIMYVLFAMGIYKDAKGMKLSYTLPNTPL